MDEELLEKVKVYAAAHGCTIGETLGFGIHGIVVVLKSENEAAATALKVHSFRGYQRERAVYERLGGARITKMLGFHIPQLLRCDDGLLALEMTIVAPPFALDFAGAYLDFPPRFSDEVWADWEQKNRVHVLGDDWTVAQRVLDELRDLGIHMLDPSPSNICFR